MIMSPRSRLSRLLRGDRMVLLTVIDTSDPKMIQRPAYLGPMREKKARASADHLVNCPGHFPDRWIIRVAIGRIAGSDEEGSVWDPQRVES